MLRTSLDELIKQVQQELVANERAVMTPGFKGEAAALRESATRFKTVFADIVEPYLRGSLEAAVGNKDGCHRYHVVLYENCKEPEPSGATEDVAVQSQPEDADDGQDEQGIDSSTTKQESSDAYDIAED
jgi:hypothetical protein